MRDDIHKEADNKVDRIAKRAEGTEIAIPDTVKDVKAYRRYIALKDSPALQLPNRIIETSDPNIEIDPVAHAAVIQKRIVDLPSDEIDEITRQVKGFKVLYLKIGDLKQRAFGIKKRKKHKSLSMGILDERSSELLDYFGRMLDDKEVHQIVVQQWGYDIGLSTVKDFRKKNADKITQLQEQFMKDYSGIRLSHKRGRLEELQQMYNDRKMKYEATGVKDDQKLMLSILREIRNETEDKTLRIDANVNANINVTIQNHIEQEILKGLTINDIILARAAHKMRVNPAFLVARLHESFYAKHSGFEQPDGNLKDQDVTYPSMMVYNWKEIKEQHDKVGDKGVEDAEWEEVPEEKKQVGQDIKSALLEKIKQKKEDLNRAQDRINNNTKSKPNSDET